MIPLNRVRTTAAIPEKFRGEKRIRAGKELLENQRKIKRGELEKHPFDTKFWKKAKDQLKKETHDKCAYCEAPTALVAYADVEHYRPKSKYWWLAYNYDNYLVTCQLCNQKFKDAKFPIPGSKMPAPRVRANTTDQYIDDHAGLCGPDPLKINGETEDENPKIMSVETFEQLHREEQPFLVNPYFDDPAKYFAWQVDDLLKEVELVPLNDNVKRFWEAAVNDYGLNRQELKDSRYHTFKTYRTFANTLKDPGISDATRLANKEMIEDMKADKARFAGMIRYFDSLDAAEPI